MGTCLRRIENPLISIDLSMGKIGKMSRSKPSNSRCLGLSGRNRTQAGGFEQKIVSPSKPGSKNSAICG